MRVLTLMNSAWDGRSGMCATFESFLSEIPELSCACIECGCGVPESGVVSEHFQISELTLIKNIKNKSLPSGALYNGQNASVRDSVQTRRFDFARKVRLQVFFWARDLIWKIGRWNSPELKKFIDDFSPDVFFAPVFSLNYLCDVTLKTAKECGAPLALYIGDDIYTCKKLRFSPLFWLDHLVFKRPKIRALIKRAEYIYVASEAQKAEYERIFKKECKVVIRRADFSAEPIIKEPGAPLAFLYAGNLYADRYKSIGALSRAIERVNEETGGGASLTVYTGTPLTEKMRKVISGKYTAVGGSVSRGEVMRAQEEADVLVCAEAMTLGGALTVRHSVSTKTTDLLLAAKCILAIGRSFVSQIEFFRRDDSAVIATDEEELYNAVKTLVQDREKVKLYAKKAYECGRRRCDISGGGVFARDFKKSSQDFKNSEQDFKKSSRDFKNSEQDFKKSSRNFKN